MKIALCLLTFNEHKCLQFVYPTIPAPGTTSGFDEIVAIDGNSTDGTLDFYRDHGVKVIRQTKRGRGNAFFEAVEQIEADAYIFFSPDGNEAVGDLPKFRKHLEDGADLVIATRMVKEAYNEEDENLLKPRKWANNVFNLLVNIFFRRKGPFITDSINGYRAITRQAFQSLNLDAHDYTIEYQMTMRALLQRLTIVEFPTIEGHRVAGASGAPSIPTGIKFVKRLYSEIVRMIKLPMN